MRYAVLFPRLWGSTWRHQTFELIRTVCKTNVFVREYIGEDLHVRTNRKLRDIRERFVKFEDERILIRKCSPLTLAWKDSYKGGDIPAADTADDRGGDNYDEYNKTGQEKSTGEVSESDTSDTSDSDKKCNGDEESVPEVVSNKPKIPSVDADKKIMSDVTHVTHVTPTRTDTTANLSDASNTISAESKVIDMQAYLLQKREKDANKLLLQMNKLTHFIKCSMN